MAWYHRIWKPRRGSDPMTAETLPGQTAQDTENRQEIMDQQKENMDQQKGIMDQQKGRDIMAASIGTKSIDTETAGTESIEKESTASKSTGAEPMEKESIERESMEKESIEAKCSATETTGAEPVKEKWDMKTEQAEGDDRMIGTAPATDPGLDALEPADVFAWFRRISAIPHGSFHTEKLSDFLENTAREHGLEYVRDQAGNLIIARPASAGCEKAAPLALQGHIDMVCEKEASNPINMEKEAITLLTDGEWLRADGTTLGGDDGIAVAIMLALLTDPTLKCPPLECIFTVDEEVGLLGADALDLSGLKSRRMINLDSEKEGIITAACAGGAEEVCTLPGKRCEKEGQVLEITITGLRGGHSGERIGAGRANADLLMARLLYRLEQEGKYCLISLNGGTRDNAIPRDAKAELVFTGKKVRRGAVRAAVAAFAEDIAREYSETDPDIRIRACWTGKDPLENEKRERRIAFSRRDTRRMVRFLMALPNGVIEYSPQYRDVPQTSLSLGIVRTLADGIRTHSLVRSSVNSQKQMVMDRISCIAEEFGASVMTQSAYPAWELISQSAFRDLAEEVYWRLTGKKALVQVIHGGLECGLLAAKVPGLDCISIGPDMEEVHTPSERLHVPSSARTYAYIRELLAACAE